MLKFSSPSKLTRFLVLVVILSLASASVPVLAQGGGEEPAVDQPDIVNIPGTIQPLLGCDGPWQPDCEATFLVCDEAAGLWYRSFDIPAGDYEYKVAIDGSWDENYGGNADQDGPNIVLTLTEDTNVTFIYDHATHLIVDSIRTMLVTAPGDFQDELGCAEDWDPACMVTYLQDPQRDDVFTYATRDIPVGDWEAKVAINRSMDEHYGADGEADGTNIAFSVPEEGSGVLFSYDSGTHIMTITIVAPGANFEPQGNLAEQRARWVTADTIAWDIAHVEGYTYALSYAAEGGLTTGFTEIGGADGALVLAVDEGGLGEDIMAQFPHVAGYLALRLGEDDLALVPDILRGQVAVSASDEAGNVVDATGLQIPGVLDDLYTYDGPLGVTFDTDGAPTLSLWAPTARRVTLLLFDVPDFDAEPALHEMVRDEFGVWRVTGGPGWRNKFYNYEVEVYAPSTNQIEVNFVTDPYAMSLSVNSRRSQIVDMNDPALMPKEWLETSKPELAAPEDIVLYELHVRDFSIRDETVPEAYRGTFMAFTVEDSDGMTHLRNLAGAGLTHIHLLPVFDIATINENARARSRFEPDWEELSAFPGDSPEQQAIIDPLRDLDGFNWGYDPYHFNVPEGSYATDPNGSQRILEFRSMVQALNQNGLRVVMDVVYNHTNASGQSDRAVFDRIVPGYYHRLNDRGQVETSTCCANTASEHNMMGRFMVDSVVFWATQYRVDGFRFDLMGHHMRDDMVAVRDALDALTVDQDGVDGAAIYIYGEGWDFGEVAGNARGVNATQLNMGGTGIGTFNDRLRDSVRGGNPFGDRLHQGFINGLYNAPNGDTPGDEDEQHERLLHYSDRIRVGLAGNLRDYTFVGYEGEIVSGADVDYNGSPSGYTLDPQEHIVYVSAHDNETLFDIIQYKAPDETTVPDRVRMQNMGLDIVMFSQGVPFFHAGSDMLRSKSLDRDSYNSGDWFNALDFTYQTNNWRVGLPPAGPNQAEWPIMAPLLAREDITPSQEDILNNVIHFQEILQIRRSSPLFRLGTAEQVMERVTFHNTGPVQVPGVIAMGISDMVGADLDPDHQMIVVIFNATPYEVTIIAPAVSGYDMVLHPVLEASNDPIVGDSAFDASIGAFNVPGLTTAVFVLPE